MALFDEVVDRRVEEIRSNGLALERMIDPGGVPDDLMAVQRRILEPGRLPAG